MMMMMGNGPTTAHNHHHHHHSHSSSIHTISQPPPPVEYSYPRRRLYPAIPNRTFICVRAHKAAQEGEIELRKGDVIELLSVGDAGYWEGKTSIDFFILCSLLQL